MPLPCLKCASFKDDEANTGRFSEQGFHRRLTPSTTSWPTSPSFVCFLCFHPFRLLLRRGIINPVGFYVSCNLKKSFYLLDIGIGVSYMLEYDLLNTPRATWTYLVADGVSGVLRRRHLRGQWSKSGLKRASRVVCRRLVLIKNLDYTFVLSFR